MPPALNNNNSKNNKDSGRGLFLRSVTFPKEYAPDHQDGFCYQITGEMQ